MKRLILLGGLVAATAAIVAVITVVVAEAVLPDDVTVAGKLELVDPGLDAFNDDTCAGSGGFSDIRKGGRVVITSGKTGEVLGIGPLSEGRWATGSKLCTFQFSISVRGGEGFYGVEITHRGSVKYAEAELAEPLSLSIR